MKRGESVARLSSKFQISVPKSVREQQGWKPGQELAFVPTGQGDVVLVPVPTVDELHGMFSSADTSDIRDHTDRY